mgnify:CR=1 FL=1
MRVAYGFQDRSLNERFLDDAKKSLAALHEAVMPGRYLVNTLPILKHIPEWLPGAGFKVQLRKMAELRRKTRVEPFELAKLEVVCSVDKTDDHLVN